MSAQMRILPQQDADQGFSLLKDIVEMVKNPKAIDEAYERRRKAAALSDDEVNQANDARALIIKSDSLKSELKLREDNLASAQILFEERIRAHADHVKSDEAKLAEWEKRLQDISDEHTNREAKQAEAVTKLDARAKEMEAEYSKWQQERSDVLTSISETKKAQEEENNRLIDLAQKLKAKAERIAAEAQSDD